MSTIDKKTIQAFIADIANKDYSGARSSLQNAVAEKIKTRIRNYVSQENTTK